MDEVTQENNRVLPPAGKRLPPAAGMGRKKGVQNKNTRALKDAILLAAELSGSDGEGKEGLVGYLRALSIKEPAAFATLLGKVLPLQVTGADGGPLEFAWVQ